MSRMRGEAELSVQPVLYFKKGEHLITGRELDILQAVHKNGSQNKAAAALGISAPVLNKRLKGLEKKLDVQLVEANPLRSRLTIEGIDLLELRRRSRSKLFEQRELVIGATPILEDRLRRIIPGDALLLISNDEHNVTMFKAGQLAVMFLDDPEFLMDLTDRKYSRLVDKIVEVGQDKLLHFRKGKDYIRYGYGAQRLGFRHLQARGKKPRISKTTLDVSSLFSSGHSFFLNKTHFRGYSDRGLLAEELLEGYEVEEMLVHSLNAVILKQAGPGVPQEIGVFLSDLSRTQE